MSLVDEQDSVRFNISGNSSDQTHGSRETTEKSSQKSSQRSSQRILELVAADDKITTQEMADKLDISRRAVQRLLQNCGQQASFVELVRIKVDIGR